MGVEFLMPDKIHVNGEWHSNPHIVWKDDRAVGVYILKHGIAIAPEGIRYLQPNLDYVDLNALIAAMAMNTFDKVRQTSQDGAKSCSRAIFEKMKAQWEKPGDPDWFFVQTLDSETGIAFNQNEQGDAGGAIRKLQSDIVMMRRNPLRKLQTATDRLVLEKLFPETVTSYVEGTVEKCDNFGNTLKSKPNMDKKWLTKIKTAKFKVKVPTKAPVARSLLTELGIALRDNDAEARERKFGQIMSALGGTVDIKSLPAGELQAEDIQADYDNPTVVEASGNRLPPIDARIGNRDFKVYVKENWQNFTNEQKHELHKASGAGEGEATKINKDNWRELHQMVMDWAGIAPPESGEVTPDEMRKHMLDWIMDQDGNMRFLSEILKKHDQPTDVDFGFIPDETVTLIYGEFLDQLNSQEQTQDETN
jgi:hypothetical protein